MFLLRQPSLAAIEAFLRAQDDKPYSYAEVGATATEPPRQYVVDRYRVRLGEGTIVLERAVAAIRRWAMFDIGWARIFPTAAPIERGQQVCSLVRHLGFWSLNPCRIVYLVDKKDETGSRSTFGFAFGTLEGHAERGEERFQVEVDPTDGSVWYDVVAFSSPASPLSRIGGPITRNLQRRFARDSQAAMLRATSGGPH